MNARIFARRSSLMSKLLAFVLCVTGIIYSQSSPELSPLSLQQAATIALEKNPLHKAAMADTRAMSAGIEESRSFLMPRVAFSEAAVRGDDPVCVFGAKLRQQRFTADNFAPHLNKLKGRRRRRSAIPPHVAYRRGCGG
jgi:outer membrane protein TolC